MTEPEPARPAEDDEALRQRWREAQVIERETAARTKAERAAAELEVWKEEQHALDVAQPTTMRQRLAHARALVESGLIPAGWTGARAGTVLSERQLDKAAAAVVLGEEWGRHLGFQGMAALQHLQVVEGHVGVKPASARGMILAAGCDLDDHLERSAAGFPVAHTVTLTRPGLTPKSATFTLSDALQARLISEIVRDEAGTVTGVVARSEKGNPLPWESYTKAMLRHRATAEIISAYAMDITGGMELGPEFEEPAARQSATGPAPAVAETLARVAPEPEPDETYEPYHDVAAIGEALGIPDGRMVPWAEHADARERLGVKRRSRVQLAADRIAAWVAAHPEQARERGLVTAVDDVVDAEIVDTDQGSAGQPVNRPGEAGNAATTQALPADPAPPVAPFRDEEVTGPLPGVEDVALPEAEFEVVGTERAGLDPFDPHGDIAGERAAAVAAELAEASQEEARAEPTVEDLLAVVDALAAHAGQTRNQYARRAIALRRRNPEDWTAGELADFIHSVAPDADLSLP